MKDLSQCRTEIDAIDAQLVALFEQRMRVSRDVALCKAEKHMDILDASREEAVLAGRAALVSEDALRAPTVALYREIMRLSREEQRRFLESRSQSALVAYNGVPGAFSEEAVVGFFGEDCARINFKTFDEVFAAVADGHARYGVVPVENSSSGSINTVYDLMGREQWSGSVTGVSDMQRSTPVTWNLTDKAGRRVPRGIYLYRATVSEPGGEPCECGTKRIAVTD